MLILPPGHAMEVRRLGRISKRERWMLGGVVTLSLALVVALVVALAIPGTTSSHGCIHVTFASATGAAELNQCGAAARESCRSPNSRGVVSGPALVTACRQAGLPTGR